MADFVEASRTDGAQIAEWLAAGQVVVVPTETVYGIAALPTRPEAVQRIFALKGRPGSVNLPVVVGAVTQLEGLGVNRNAAARALAAAFWPGPLTIVFGFDPDAPRPAWLAGREEVAVRLPDYDLLREAAARAPFLLTSANRHGVGAQYEAAAAVASLVGPPDAVVDGGSLTPTPSTIVNTRLDPPCVERIGAVPVAQIRALLGEVTHG